MMHHLHGKMIKVRGWVTEFEGVTYAYILKPSLPEDCQAAKLEYSHNADFAFVATDEEIDAEFPLMVTDLEILVTDREWLNEKIYQKNLAAGWDTRTGQRAAGQKPALIRDKLRDANLFLDDED